MPVSRPILRRLGIASYLIRQARISLADGGSFCAGRCALNLQDGVELFLRAAAEQHQNDTLKEKASFEDLWKAAADAAKPDKLTHRLAMSQVNRDRVSFKHHGLEPTLEDAAKLQADVESFFPDALWKLFRLAPEQLSLAELVTHRRTRNWLVKAEFALSTGSYSEAIAASAIAFRLYLNCAQRDHAQTRGGLSREHRRQPWSDLAREVEDEISELRSAILGALYGVNMADYRRFIRHTPYVAMMGAGNFELWQPHEKEATREIATFCVRFTIDGVLTMQQNRLRPTYDFRERPDYAVRVVHAAELIVYPTDEPEAIRPVTVGEVLFAFANPKEGGFVRVRDGEEVGFLPVSAVVPVKREVGTRPE